MPHVSSMPHAGNLLYGPELFRLIESPEFRAHFDQGAGPVVAAEAQIQELRMMIGSKLELHE
jgi:hypothetical protein